MIIANAIIVYAIPSIMSEFPFVSKADKLVQINFYIRGPHGAGKVYTEMFKDKVDKQWKYTYLMVDISAPSKTLLMLESYVPA